MLTDKLSQLQTENEPQSMEELFNQSKEGMMADRVKQSVEMMLPQMKMRILEEMKMILSEEIKNQIGQIKVRDGRDGKDGKSVNPEEVAKIVLDIIPKPKDGRDGKDAPNINEIIAKIPRPVSKGGGSTVIMEDLSSQCNGVLKTFSTTKKIGTPLLVASTQFPQILRPTIDYSASGTTLTLSSEVGAPETNQTLIIIYVEG